MQPKITPVLLAGGSGTRLWPLSTSKEPKQFAELFNTRPSLFQQACLRVRNQIIFTASLCVSNFVHKHHLDAHAQSSITKPETYLLEPSSRNTTAAIAVASLYAPNALQIKGEKDPVLLIMPCDHVIDNQDSFEGAIIKALPTALDGQIVCFGLRPRYAATEYGYIEVGSDAVNPSAVLSISRFVEKPDVAQALSFIEHGNYFWNAGLFLARSSTLITELIKHAPKTFSIARHSLEKSTRQGNYYILSKAQYSDIPAISFDYTVMENTDRAVMVEASFDWQDVGNYNALSQCLSRDQSNASEDAAL